MEHLTGLVFLETHVRQHRSGEFGKKRLDSSGPVIMMHLLFCGTSRVISRLHLFLPEVGLLLFTNVTEWSSKEWLPSSIQVKSLAPNRTRQHPQSKPTKTLGAKPLLGLSGWQDTAPSSLQPEKLKKCRLFHRPPEGMGMEKRGPVTYPESRRPVRPMWPCLGSCPCSCQRPAQPKEGERIKQRIGFLFSCKKPLPPGNKCYCICVALYCRPQLASITGSQWQYFYNPWSIAYFYRLQSQLPIRSV